MKHTYTTDSEGLVLCDGKRIEEGSMEEQYYVEDYDLRKVDPNQFLETELEPKKVLAKKIKLIRIK